MSNIINLNKQHGKDCPDWVPLKDGTKTGDPKYCDRSLECRQLGMKSDWYEFFDYLTQEFRFDYFCTGMYMTNEDKGVDEEVT